MRPSKAIPRDLQEVKLVMYVPLPGSADEVLTFIESSSSPDSSSDSSSVGRRGAGEEGEEKKEGGKEGGEGGGEGEREKGKKQR